MTTWPSPVTRRGWRARSRAFTASGALPDAAMFQRSTALVETLFTFCPPGPPARAKVKWISRRGMRSLSFTMSMGILPGASAGRRVGRWFCRDRSRPVPTVNNLMFRIPSPLGPFQQPSSLALVPAFARSCASRRIRARVQNTPRAAP